MQVYLFPGQGAQFPGMGKELYEASPIAKERFEQANEILGFNIKDIMFGEDAVTGNEATAKVIIDRSKHDIRYGSNSFFDNLGDKAIYNDFELDVTLKM